jgi:hypothetical protein
MTAINDPTVALEVKMIMDLEREAQEIRRFLASGDAFADVYGGATGLEMSDSVRVFLIARLEVIVSSQAEFLTPPPTTHTLAKFKTNLHASGIGV